MIRLLLLLALAASGRAALIEPPVPPGGPIRPVTAAEPPALPPALDAAAPSLPDAAAAVSLDAVAAAAPVAPRVVVIGAGFGGLEAARTLARARLPTTVLDRKN